MVSEDLYIDGAWPDFAGKTLEHLIAQESWFEGELDDEANVVWLCVDGAWHRLYFDDDVVFWRSAKEGPRHDSETGEGFPLNDLGEKHALAGQALAACHGDAIEEGAAVSLAFASGKTITFRNRYDTTTIQVG